MVLLDLRREYDQIVGDLPLQECQALSSLPRLGENCEVMHSRKLEGVVYSVCLIVTPK